MKSNKYTARKADFLSIGEGIQDFLDVYNLEKKYLQTVISSKWEALMGASVATRTEKIYFKNNTMYVVINSAALRHQLHLSKSQIVTLVNEEMKQHTIDDVVIL